MKKSKFVTKLILGGVAFAVSAATLVSTTYAWYVQNSQVTATGVSGSVKDKDASSIFISRDFAEKGNVESAATWGYSVDFTGNVLNAAGTGANAAKFIRDNENGLSTAKGASKVFDGSLEPITWNGTNFVYPSAQTTRVAQATEQLNDSYNVTVTAANRVIEFDVFVKSTISTVQLTPNLIITNTTTDGTAKKQTAYTALNYETSGVKQGQQFWVDAVQALRLKVDVNYYDTSWKPVNENTSNGVYDVLKIAKASYDNNTQVYTPYTVVSGSVVSGSLEEANFADKQFYVPSKDTSKDNGKKYYERNASGSTMSFTEKTTAIVNPYAEGLFEETTLKGANAYYNELVGRAPAAGYAENAWSGSNKLNDTAISATTLAQNGKVYRFTFKLWLEGTDPSCFDSCEGQKFNITVNFDGNNGSNNPAQS